MKNFTIILMTLLVFVSDVVWSGKPNNSPCKADKECSNTPCARKSAAKDAPLVCCPSGRSGLYAAYYYCYGMLDGSTCWSNAMCASNYCKGNCGGVCRGTCFSRLPINRKCDEDDDCLNGVCARGTAAKGAVTVCCPSGLDGVYGGYSYCYGMPDGSTCWSNAMCGSKFCKGNCGGVCRGSCFRKRPANSPCASDEDCSNGACARPSAAKGTPLRCCPSGNDGVYAGYSYCYSMPDGTTCWSDAMCASKYCSGNWWGTRRGTCKRNSG